MTMTEAAELTDDSRIARAEGPVASEVDGEVVILDVESGHFFQLNGVGSSVWQRLESPMTLGALCTAMLDEFEVDAAQCRSDVRAFAAKMLDRGLLVRA
jgi:phosphatidylserine decarboxylase